MHCYKTYAAITIVANYFEIMPAVGRKLPHAAIADWMAQNDIEPEDVLYAAPETVKARLTSLVDGDLPRLPNAA